MNDKFFHGRSECRIQSGNGETIFYPFALRVLNDGIRVEAVFPSMGSASTMSEAREMAKRLADKLNQITEPQSRQAAESIPAETFTDELATALDHVGLCTNDVQCDQCRDAFNLLARYKAMKGKQ